ncbi:DUF1097 domain-containing protein [Lentilactobacillus hilgardii]|uniref:DUF1097 domain-containing protein n=1 Tax=Lentilactobacillus hilgardii (strain ATCC 8290 / DSM 20176 / CCUG 30140 / JCM 1155 / KCTC 3500 / NBRC 15886 / NCIMB 8040 / NRRL B-1843 / 9) TaxID=1423757 RepID=C0XJA0_LENH9|nr:DUF1097 domain-containing protein [Lentilactobacillus hilgardii]EEI24545.1 hypothetical protein HMPREF0519_1311 [Lentilactobacillus hilgardii DSM 20176 = ATCC 8290]KRK52612.1 hypothetical protein FD42_GL002417 [Lentilactobacillus hilgardii DSM 20176 = ATCC 8290]MCP9333206.1 DUF1097 domain-containing protein [Lentilactobacillus hilgardii]MCP9349778.1 DUF1097 domain-containing protein [Lentilactobacillus hilgardii]MCP9352706.1 DUF1097 domain-containing protein [Lentilactobacillus hilgardii]
MKQYIASGKEVTYSALGIGIFTFFYGLISGSLAFWMAPVAFITSAFYAGMDESKKNPWNVSLSFGMGIIWGLIAYNLFQIPNMNMLWWTSSVFGIMALIAILLQGTVLKATFIPAWLLAWGTFMEISLNIKINNWYVFVLQLACCMLLGVFFLDYGSDFFKAVMYRWFPEKDKDQSDPKSNKKVKID